MATPSLHDDQKEIIARLHATFAFMPDEQVAAEELRQWLTWQLREFLEHVGPARLTISELMALVGVLGPAFSRFLIESGPAHSVPVGPQLRAV